MCHTDKEKRLFMMLGLCNLVASPEVHSADYLSHRGLAGGIETPQEISRLIANESVAAGTSAHRPARLRGFEASARHMHADKRGSSPATRGQRARLKLINVLAKGHLLGPCTHVCVLPKFRVHVLQAHGNMV